MSSALAKYHGADSIFAITAFPGSIAVIRVSGQALELLMAKVFRLQNFLPRRMIRAEFLFDGAVLDDLLLCFFKGPESFTGEDVLEIFPHGSRAIIDAIISTLVDFGCRQAFAGEFSFRAVRNAKIDIGSSEAIRLLIESQTVFEAKIAAAKLKTGNAGVFSQINTEVTDLLSRCELGIDFSDQDVPQLQPEAFAQELSRIIEYINKVISAGFQVETVFRGHNIVLAGAPNAGKSALFNALVEADRSIVTNIAGTTRDVVSESSILSCENRSFRVRFLDTAGLRTAQDPVEEIGIERTKKELAAAEIICFVHDLANDPGSVVDFCLDDLNDRELIHVGTKLDLLNQEQVLLLQKTHPNWIFVSSVTLHGLSELKDKLSSLLSLRELDLVEKPFLLGVDASGVLNELKAILSEAMESRDSVILSHLLRDALDALSKVTHETTNEDVLANIFSRYCIGK